MLINPPGKYLTFIHHPVAYLRFWNIKTIKRCQANTQKSRRFFSAQNTSISFHSKPPVSLIAIQRFPLLYI
jgi:hypothetical protein